MEGLRGRMNLCWIWWLLSGDGDGDGDGAQMSEDQNDFMPILRIFQVL